MDGPVSHPCICIIDVYDEPFVEMAKQVLWNDQSINDGPYGSCCKREALKSYVSVHLRNAIHRDHVEQIPGP